MALLTTMLTAGSGGANQDLNTGSSPTFNNLTLTGGVTVSGAAILKTNLTVEGTTTLSGAATLKTSLNVEGATTLSGNAVAKGNVLIEGNITISGAATFKGGLTFEGALVAKTTLSVEGATTLSGAATMKGVSTFEAAVVMKTTLNVEGATTLSDAAVLKSTLNVEGETTLSATVTIKTVGFCQTPTTSTHIANKGYVDTAVAAFSGINKNLIIGGNFDTNPWQRGTSFTAPASGAFVADRFSLNIVGAGVINILKTADAPTVAEAGIFSSNCFHWDVTTADASLAATDNYNIRYAIEGYDWAQIAQRAFTLSFWVKATKTGIYSVGFRNSGVDRSYVAEYTVNTTDTWEKKTITVSASPSAGTWNYTTGIGALLFFNVANGSNFNTSSLNTWNSDGLISSTNQVNGMDDTANNFKLALIKVEPGSSATAWEVRPEEEELELCQRYYEKTFNVGTAPVVAASSGGCIGYSAQVAGTVQSGINWRYKIKKRTAPTVTFYGLATTTLWRNATASADSGASSLASQGEDSCIALNAGAAGDGAGATMGIHATAEAEL